MPNWTSNTLEVTGEAESVGSFLEAIRWEDDRDPGTPKCRLVNLLPMPSILESTTSPKPSTPEGEALSMRARAETGYDNWHQWQEAHWGVKWGDTYFDHEMSEDGQLLTYRFNTPWQELSGDFMRVVREAFPSLGFELTYQHEDESGERVVSWVPLRGGS